MEDATRQRISEHWDSRIEKPKPTRINWWESPMVRQHINRLLGSPGSDVFGQGLVDQARAMSGNRSFALGVSVGCGTGSKEFRLLQQGLVERFLLFELSEARIERGRALAKKLGLQDRVEFRKDDAFTALAPGSVDFVHWDNSLHHMFDTPASVRWSHEVLSPGGMFYMNDYVGPTRWQWSDESLALIAKARAILPARLMKNPWFPDHTDREFLTVSVPRKTPQRIAQDDPSEAADSGRILEAVLESFPGARITRTGGIIYHLALSQVYHHINESDEYDRALLASLLLLDELCLSVPTLETHYATALAIKPKWPLPTPSGTWLQAAKDFVKAKRP